MKYYVDDIIVKLNKVPDHVGDLRECFQTLRKNNIRLNPKKCTFGVSIDKISGFMVKTNPEKIKAILDEEAQRRFIFQSAHKALPFFDTFRGSKTFTGIPECQAAFDQLKHYLANPPLIDQTKPEQRSVPLFICLTTGHGCGSSQRKQSYSTFNILHQSCPKHREISRFDHRIKKAFSHISKV